jgi:Double-GTPase 2
MTDSENPAAPEDATSASIDEVLQEAAPSAETPSGAGVSQAQVQPDRPGALTTEQANNLASRRRPTVLVLAGAIGCGKTSVYAAIYERLGRGPFGGYTFAGSETIPGFEQRCHWWRTASGTTDQYMRHTQAEDLPWLHIRLRDVEQREPARDLLFGDFDGEFFEQFANNLMQAEQLPFLRRADHVGLVIDGSKIASAVDRAAEHQRVDYLLERMLQPGTLASPEALSLVVTKVDCLSPGEDLQGAEEALAAINRKANELAHRALPMLRLAVHSYDPRYPLGHGLETLLELLGVMPCVQITGPNPAYVPAGALGRFRA